MSAALLRKARHELGVTGLIALALFGAAALFFFLAVKPLEARNALVESELAQAERQAPGGRAPAAGARLAAFYRYFETGEAATDWLARLSAIGASSGVQIRSADYRLQKTGTRLERYEVVLPLTGSYPQIRAFLATALAEIPVLSLDQITIKKERAQGGAVEAEARLTLHLTRP
jgi:hypothetical protein